jgi:hypothetical protein
MSIPSKPRTALRSIGYRVALRLVDVSASYLEAGQEVPKELLTREFNMICSEKQNQDLTADETKRIARDYAPKAMKYLQRRRDRDLAQTNEARAGA